ncbi:phosphatase PAP2 family protein [Paraburkholderia phymatum]|uniref:Phosphoesterase PA-phosphatase related n=1 Tax=Paraburkholderia phymatum (strain DSM 17167 / CIP 108236 / LMG 21445 / STM815) TaxID=391038 RepID=B2JUG6_PARP8|nr:phosphatase PAP2 family protein [Paraburkholderia phymatum]ACC74688.1 phosphoesterase PA-phosphatase related [Paraburkholderia phymatum STM815]
MPNFDVTIETYLTQIHLGPLPNLVMRALTDMYTFRGLVLIPILWWIWFQPGERRNWKREVVIATVVSGLLALFAGRVLADLLPFRVRPIYDPDLHLHFASSSLGDAKLSSWSSFPSDHAMLWMAVATGIFIVSRLTGIAVIAYTAVFICFPRAYLGFHHPTDLLAGAAIGIATTYLMTRAPIRARYAAPSLHWMERYPGPASVFAFVVCFELVTQFDEVRRLASAASKAL